MSIAKVIEVMAQSPESFEAAVQEGLAQASKTVKNIENLYVKEMQAVVEDNRITQYRVNVKVTFLVGD